VQVVGLLLGDESFVGGADEEPADPFVRVTSTEGSECLEGSAVVGGEWSGHRPR
jgi:hypothetical protein